MCSNQILCKCDFRSCLSQLCAAKKWSRWLLVPWLVMYSLNIIILLSIAIIIFISPPPLKTDFNNQFLR